MLDSTCETWYNQTDSIRHRPEQGGISVNHANGFQLSKTRGYFQNQGVNVMAFDDIYPCGHQSGVSILMHGRRVATNGDIRFEQAPGQWQPFPKQNERILSEENNTIVTRLSYPDHSQHLCGSNPLIYPDLDLNYQVTVRGEGDHIVVTVDLGRPVPPEFAGKLCFNLELFPGDLFGKPWLMDGQPGIFPTQPNGPVKQQPANYAHSQSRPMPECGMSREMLTDHAAGYQPSIADDLIAEPYAVGHCLVVRPDDDLSRLTIESSGALLKLYDGRMNHNNGWFVVSSEVPEGVTENAIRWTIRPNAADGWIGKPTVQTSQVGYHPAQPKTALIELDPNDTARPDIQLLKLTESGMQPVKTLKRKPWGRFLRYEYLQADFTGVTEPGMYQIRFGEALSPLFRIGEDVYDRGVWQPVLEYFLPVQMCHMRVNEKYRVWHGLCHNDDARMAPVNHTHFDGYYQGPSTLTAYQPGEHVPGLNVGGWHDAGDYDLRVESQAGECYILTMAYEAFHVQYDATTIDQQRKVVEIHEPDGKNDILQQIEHGLLSVVGAYRALGRLYRGIIGSHLRQYVLLGDGSTMTDGIPGNDDDRWVFTVENPSGDLMTASHLAASARAMRGFNDELSAQTLEAAENIFQKTPTQKDDVRSARIHAAAELFLTTGAAVYREALLESADFIAEHIESLGWIAARVVRTLNDEAFTQTVRSALPKLVESMKAQSGETPYGIPYRPHIWGAGWGIQSMGFQYYFLHDAFPELFGPELVFSALNFVLGCHPGSNTSSFASGVGAKSATVAYGANRADWSFIPGGVISGTALIRPDFPELLEFPFLWQQTEYVLGGGSSHYLFLVLAAQHILKQN